MNLARYCVICGWEENKSDYKSDDKMLKLGDAMIARTWIQIERPATPRVLSIKSLWFLHFSFFATATAALEQN